MADGNEGGVSRPSGAAKPQLKRSFNLMRREAAHHFSAKRKRRLRREQRIVRGAVFSKELRELMLNERGRGERSYN